MSLSGFCFAKKILSWHGLQIRASGVNCLLFIVNFYVALVQIYYFDEKAIFN